jgi:hypothetical protein
MKRLILGFTAAWIAAGAIGAAADEAGAARYALAGPNIEALIVESSQFRECVTAAEDAGRTVPSTLTARFIVRPSGELSRARIIRAERRDFRLERCVSKAIEAQEYPASTGGVPRTIVYSLHTDGMGKRNPELRDDPPPAVYSHGAYGSGPQATEVLTPERVDWVVVRAPVVQACLDRAVWEHQDLPERIWVRFTVRPDGSIPEAHVATMGLPDSGLEECLVAGIVLQEFPSFDSDGNKIVKVPLDVQPSP